jgi:hypothetical protein
MTEKKWSQKSKTKNEKHVFHTFLDKYKLVRKQELYWKVGCHEPDRMNYTTCSTVLGLMRKNQKMSECAPNKICWTPLCNTGKREWVCPKSTKARLFPVGHLDYLLNITTYKVERGPMYRYASNKHISPNKLVQPFFILKCFCKIQMTDQSV